MVDDATRRILIVDDDHDVATALQEFLKHKHCESVIFGNGAKGLQAVESSHFDVAIVDLVMPDMDGIETIRAFHKSSPTLPIILMTGYGFGASHNLAPNFLGMAAKLGAACCIRKPIQPRQLLDSIEACLVKPSTEGARHAADGALRV
jgi:DNA-binding NtrC family response regulator